jgi:hypothetical protein
VPIVLLMIIVLSLVGLLVISFPVVQTHLAHRLTKNINRNLQTEMRVEGVTIGFDGSVNLSSFFIADHHSDTLFYAKNFKTDLYSLRQWVNGNLFFSTTEFEDILFKITHYKGEENNALIQFTDKLLSHAEPQGKDPVFVRIDDLNILDGRFLMVDKNSSDRPVQLKKISLSAYNFFVVNDGVEVVLKNLKFDSKDYGKVNLYETEFYYHPCAIDLRSFQLSTGESQLQGEISLLLPQGSFQGFVDQALIDLDLEGVFSREELLNFVDLPEDFQPIELQFSAKGSPNDMEFTHLEVNQEAVQIKTKKIDLKEAFSSEPMKALIKMESLKIVPSQLTQIIPSVYHDRIPTPFFEYESFQGSGTLSFEKNQLKSDLLLTSGNATVVNRTRFDLISDQGKFKLNRFEGTTEIEQLDLSPWHPKLGRITSQFLIRGNKRGQDNFDLDFDIDLNQIFFYDKPINNLSLKGVLKDKELTAELIVEDKYLTANSEMAYSWGESESKYQFDLNLDRLNLHQLDEELGGGKAVYSGALNLFLVGDTFDEIQGNLLFKNIQFENQTQVDSFNDFILETSISGQKRIIRTINSDIIDIYVEGEFQLSKLGSLFSNAIAEAFPFVNQKKIERSQDLIYDISVQTAHLGAVFPNLVIDKKAVFRGVLSTQDNISKMTLNVPKIAFKELNTENLSIQLDNQNPFFNTFVSIGKIESDSYVISELNTLGVKAGDTLNFRTEFYGRKSQDDVYQLNYALILNQSKPEIYVKPSNVQLNRNVWNINPLFDQKHLISYNNSTKSIDLNFLEAQSGDGRIEIKGNFQSLENFGLVLDVDKVSLQNVGISSEDFNFRGALDLNMDIKRSPTDNTLKFNGFVDDLVMNDLEMGSLRFFTSGNTQLNSYEVNLLLSDQGKSTLSAKGNILGFDQTPRLDIDFDFNDFDLSFLTAVGAGDVDNIRGKVSGGVNLWGPIDGPKHNGQLILNDGGLGIPDIHTDYSISNGTKVTLVDQSFNFNKTTFRDTRFGTEGELEGQINHLNFSDWGFDLDIASERILMLNIPEQEEEVFFGDGYLGGKVHLYGPSKSLTIDLVGATEKGTSIKIPWADDYGLADTSFMKFIDKRMIHKAKQQNIDESYSISGLQMNFELDINNNAEIKVVIDKESGSFLSGRGAGNILMEIDTNGKFNMWGDFITYDGIYNFKNLSVIDKKFDLKQGGTIVWEGDPLGAQMDLEAVYQVPGGANPAILLDNPNFNRKIPTEVLIRLQGNLLKPDDPIFEIEFPNTSAVVNSEINYRLADPQISQLQAISLLSQGIFINEVTVSVQGITNNLYEKASDLFSNLMGDDEGKLQVGLNYLQGDSSRVLDINSEDRLGLTLSTQITDRILLNGNIGVPVGGIEETLIVGDLQIDFILNAEGSLKAKVFNKENEFRYIGDELGYTQGVGLSYQVDFETFRELITKIVKGGQLRQATERDPLVSEPSDAGINFINKN